jgi:hypothetical protein
MPLVRSVIGPLVIVAVAATVTASLLGDECVCSAENDCVCLNQSERLHDVSERELRALPDPTETEYRQFLAAWETEYRQRLRMWTQLRRDFFESDHTPEAAQEFDRQLRQAHDEFVGLFRYRHGLYRDRNNIGE